MRERKILKLQKKKNITAKKKIKARLEPKTSQKLITTKTKKYERLLEK